MEEENEKGNNNVLYKIIFMKEYQRALFWGCGLVVVGRDPIRDFFWAIIFSFRLYF